MTPVPPFKGAGSKNTKRERQPHWRPPRPCPPRRPLPQCHGFVSHRRNGRESGEVGGMMESSFCLNGPGPQIDIVFATKGTEPPKDTSLSPLQPASLEYSVCLFWACKTDVRCPLGINNGIPGVRFAGVLACPLIVFNMLVATT